MAILKRLLEDDKEMFQMGKSMLKMTCAHIYLLSQLMCLLVTYFYRNKMGLPDPDEVIIGTMVTLLKKNLKNISGT